MLFKLAFQNIKKSFKDYAIYFFTLILGVAIFYIFNSLESQTVLLNVSSRTKEIILLMMNMLSGVSVFVAFVLGFLIIYASRFLMKRRNKEFGIYLTLGMSKGSISKVLFLETIFIGLISLIVGLLGGIFLSQAMSVFVANSFEADMTNFTFVFSHSAMIKTMIYFGIMYLCVMIFNTISVSKCKLIDLLQSSRKSETIKLKNPLVCLLVFLVSACGLGYAYYMVTIGIDQLQDASQIFIPIGLGIVTTFLIIWSLSGIFLRVFLSFKKFYYHRLNSFTMRQISSKINTTVVSMGVITLMLFLTICILSSALSIKNSMTFNLKTMVPADVLIKKRVNLEQKFTVTGTPYSTFLNEADRLDTTLSVWETIGKSDESIYEYLTDVISFDTYEDSHLTFKETLGNAYDRLQTTYSYLDFDEKEEIIRISDYNKLAQFYGISTYELEDDEYIILADFDGLVSLRNEGLRENTPIRIQDRVYYPKYDTCQSGFIYMAQSHVNGGLFIVPDDAVIGTVKNNNVLVANYVGNTKKEKENVENKINSLSQTNYMKALEQSKLSFSSKISIYESSVGLSAMVTFIGLYLGIIFLISSAAILALKELSESADNKERFQMLRKIGTDEKMIDQALFRQIALFFLFPLIFALIHSIFGIQFCNYILETFGNEKLLQSILMTTLFIVFIYGGYFWITYWCSKNMIKEKTRY
ncbi:MAG: ABC transporter permease [Bacilli bacterium]|nr:ABC transporter permease [Bacilli bacterium]